MHVGHLLLLASCLALPSCAGPLQRGDDGYQESLYPISENYNRAGFTCFNARLLEADLLQQPILDAKIVVSEPSEEPKAFSATMTSRKEGAFQPCVPKAEVEYKISIEREGYEPIRQSVKASSTLLTFFMKPRAK